MELWQLIALLAAGAVGVGALAKSSAAQATAALPQTAPSGPSQADLLNACFQAALGTERNINVLQTFAAKLKAAGYISYANSLTSKASAITQMIMAPMPDAVLTMVPQLQEEQEAVPQLEQTVTVDTTS